MMIIFNFRGLSMTREEAIDKLTIVANYIGNPAKAEIIEAIRIIEQPWISVKDDLPCNHNELLLSTGYHTVSVFTYKKGGACGIDSMIIRNGEWEWEAWKENYLYWMPIPNLQKE